VTRAALTGTDAHLSALIARIEAQLQCIGQSPATDFSEIVLYCYQLLAQLVLGYCAREGSHVITAQSPLHFVHEWVQGRLWKHVLDLLQSRARAVRHEAVLGLVAVLRALPAPLMLVAGEARSEVVLHTLLLERVLAHLPHVCAAGGDSAEQFFLLFDRLLVQQLTARAEAADWTALVAQCVQLVRARAISETRTTTDHVLVGVLRGLTTLLEHCPELLAQLGKALLLFIARSPHRRRNLHAGALRGPVRHSDRAHQ
jgi:hypothetical protein